MCVQENGLPRTSPTRREFLKTSSALGSCALLITLDVGRIASGAPADQGPPTAAPLTPGGVITVRGHHLFDMLDALGTGTSSHKTLGPVAQKIRAQPKAPIRLVIGVDDICAPCEWWDQTKSHCKRSLEKYPQDNQNSLTSDANAIRTLGMKPGAVMPADELYRRIKSRVDKKRFAEEVCVACRLVDKCKETYEPRIAAAVAALAAPSR